MRAFQNAARVGTVTIEQIRGLWQEKVAPNIDAYYNAAIQHADTIQDPDDRQDYLDQNHLQSPEAFGAYLVDTYLNPVIDAQTADNIADGLERAKFNLDAGVRAFRNAASIPGITLQRLQELWDQHVLPNIQSYYDAALAHADTISDADDRDLYIDENALESPEAFAQSLADRIFHRSKVV